MKNNRKHGMRNTRFYRIRYNILGRCNREGPRSDNYKNKGVKCLRNSFDEFKDDMYKKYVDHVHLFGEKQTSINRIDNEGNYCKENCERATSRTQSLNTSRNLILELNGIKKTSKERSEILGINENTIRVRYMRGHDPLYQGKIYRKNSLALHYKEHKRLLGNNSVSYHTFRQRIRRHGMSIEHAIKKGKF